MQLICVIITLMGCATSLTSVQATKTYDSYDVDLNDKNLDLEFAYAQLEDNIFAEIGEKFHPERVLYYLKKWRHVMTLVKVPENKYVRQYREEQRRDVDDLIDVSIRTPSKCENSSYEQIDYLMRRFKFHQYQVIPYLRYHKNLLHNYCEQLLYGDSSSDEDLSNDDGSSSDDDGTSSDEERN